MNVGPTHGLFYVAHLPQGLKTVRISQHFHIQAGLQRPFTTAQSDARRHPKGIIYQTPIAYRAAAHGIENPSSVVLGYSALALYGLPYLVEGQDIVLMNPSAERNRQGNIHRPSIVRRGCRKTEVWDVKNGSYTLRVASPAAATVQALKEIRKMAKAQQPRTLAGHSLDMVEAITLLDCVQRYLGVEPLSILQASPGIVDQRWVARALAESSSLADSPKETEIRLLAQMVCSKLGLELEEQVAVYRGKKILTRFDLAIPELKIGIMYDGAHHNSATQWHKDADINSGLTIAGWRVLRFTSANVHKFVDLLTALITEVLAGR